MMTFRSSAPSPTMTCFSKSCVSGRENFTPASSIAIALASAGPIQIGRTRWPSFSCRITTGVFVVRSNPRWATRTCSMFAPFPAIRCPYPRTRDTCVATGSAYRSRRPSPGASGDGRRDRYADPVATQVSRVLGYGHLMAGNGANMLQVRVAHLGLDRTTNTPVVILQENDGQRVLPIWIGPAEASAIAMELAGVKFSRPLTHDLLKQVIVGLGAELRKVIITQVKDNTYFAELHIYRGDTVIQIDARPSDSIALALRLKAPILTSETLLELTSIDTSEGAIQPGGGSPLDADTLKSYLQNLDPEDFGKFTP